VRLFKLDPTNGFKQAEGAGELKAEVTLEGHCDPVNCVDFSQNNKLLISSSTDKSCIIFDVDQ
jgi:WD40 repeat protein